MKLRLTVLILITCLQSQAHLDYIQINKIEGIGRFSEQINLLKQHSSYFDHWIPEWNYPVSKDSVIQQLETTYRHLSKLNSTSVEFSLLMGEIAHYLYNLDVQLYYDKAEFFYKEAINASPQDYRGYWFLGHHYSLSNVLDKSAELFIRAQRWIPVNGPSGFWEEYASAMAICGMVSHCFFAMDKEKKLTGKPGTFETQVGASVRQRLESVYPDSNYTARDIWTATEGAMVTFVSRPLGIRFIVDSAWEVGLNDYNNRQTAVTIKPPVAMGRNGQSIGYTIAILVKVAEKNETLEDYLKKLLSKQEAKQFTFPTSYKKVIAYESKDKTMYPDCGGAHTHMIGVEQPDPLYPGLNVEVPIPVLGNENGGGDGKPGYYAYRKQKKRFDGRMFYVVLLDCCDDIYPEAYKVFQRVFRQQCIFE